MWPFRRKPEKDPESWSPPSDYQVFLKQNANGQWHPSIVHRTSGDKVYPSPFIITGRRPRYVDGSKQQAILLAKEAVEEDQDRRRASTIVHEERL